MAEMQKIIDDLRADLREEYDHSKMSLLLHYMERFKEEYGLYNLK